MEQPTGELSTLSRAIKSREVRAIDVVELALSRIEELNPSLNAVVARCDEQARDEARAVDAAVDAGEDPGPLAGVPVLVKDLEDVAGMRTTMGSLLFADAPLATAHSTVPARLVGAGAVIVGKSNLPEFATEGYTANRLFGTTVNPWATRVLPGRIEWWERGGGCERHGANRDSHGRRRFDPDPSGVLRSRWSEADQRCHRTLAATGLDRLLDRRSVRDHGC